MIQRIEMTLLGTEVPYYVYGIAIGKFRMTDAFITHLILN